MFAAVIPARTSVPRALVDFIFISLRICYWQLAGALALPGTETVLALNTNAPEPPDHAPAHNLPHEVAPVFIVILAAAKMFPFQIVPVPSVAELAACQ